MARSLRPNIPGGVYHVMARGNRKAEIYLDDQDRERFLHLLDRTVRRCRWDCLAYCLMANHYHLVLRTPLPNLSRGMQSLNGGYASYVNARYEHPGHVFQGRFRSVLVRNSFQLLVVMRYVLRNPIAAGLCTSPEQWAWSSYRATVADGTSGGLASGAALAWFGDDESARRRFAHFVSGDDTDAVEEALGADVEFPTDAVPSESTPSIEELLADHSVLGAIALAYNRYGYSLAKIAAVLGRSRSTVGRMLVAYESELMLASANWPRTG